MRYRSNLIGDIIIYMYTTSVTVRALVKVCYIGDDCPSFQERMNATHTQWPVFIGVWMRCSGGVHPGEVAQSGLARFEVARVEVARVRWLGLR